MNKLICILRIRMLTPLKDESNEFKNGDKKISLVAITETYLKQDENLKQAVGHRDGEK